MIIDIIGTGITASFYGWSDGHEKWSIGGAYPAYGDKVDLYFCFHDDEEAFIKPGVEFINKDSYPLEEAARHFGTRFFTSSIAYMLALAIKKTPKEIHLWGVEMDGGGAYAYEKPCVLYWIGQAEARGIKVKTASRLTEPAFLYGYDDPSGLLSQLEMRRRHAEVMAEKTEGREKDQWIGKMVALRDAINMVKS